MKKRKFDIILDGYAEEDLAEWRKLDIEYFLYAQCYEEALTAILNIIEYNKEQKAESDKHRGFLAGAGQEYDVSSGSSNIIAFMGDRGSGKTTAVNEFSRILSAYHEQCVNWKSRLVYKNPEEYHFHVLTPIDASVLEKKEDLMEVILANMYQAFREKAPKMASKSELSRRIVQNFDRAYQDYINVGKMDYKRNISEETVLARLQDTSNSLKTKNTIEKLTGGFLELLDGERKENSYLVVVIDDLDMSPENGFEMLEQLHKYLLNQRIIILIAIKYEQMKMMCNQYYADCLTPQYGGAHRDIFDQYYKHAKRLSNDYLLKVIPLSNRIYMPKSQFIEKGIIAGFRHKGQGVKEYIFTEIANRMHIYYDAAGLKKHFCLPETIREFVSYMDFLDSLYTIAEIETPENNETKRRMLLYDQNHERFNADLEYRMAMQFLDDEQLELYRMIIDRNIERRARYAVNFLNSWMQRESITDKVDAQNYCHADLLQVIYKLGREDYEDKPLVHCILASFTAEMVREYYSYRHNIDKEARGRAAKRLKCFLGNTFGGKWFDECMPTITVPDNSGRERRVGYIPNNKTRPFEFTIIKNALMQEEPDQIIDDLSDFFLCIECFLCLLTDFKDRQGRTIVPAWKIELTDGMSEVGEDFMLRISGTAETATFDFLGFIGKEIQTDEDYGNRLDKEMLKCLLTCFQGMLKAIGYEHDIIAELQEKLETEICSKSIWAGRQEEENAPFPYYDFDLSYNVMKRVMTGLRDSVFLKKMDVYDYLCTAYSSIAEELYKEEKFYRELPGIKRTPHFFENFVNSPYLKVFEITIMEESGRKIYNQQDDISRERRRAIFDETVGYLGEVITGAEEFDID